MAQVGIVMGSKSDSNFVQSALDTLDQLGISYEVSILSAHRTPDKVRTFALAAEENGIEVLIAAAGGAAHLPGVLASWTHIPVIGIPVPGGELKGMDALLSIAQMPGGVPVATMGVGKGGPKNAALFAAQILSLKYDDIKNSFINFKKGLAG
jgi:5-(carboxyamino)imidazole ribonucleotide mutase